MASTHLSRRATYSLPALQKYFTHISLPSSHQHTLLPSADHASRKEWGTSAEALRALGLLQKYQQAKIPFANIYLHYSKHHTGTLEPEGLYRYLVNSEPISRSSCTDSGAGSGSTYDAVKNPIMSHDFHETLRSRGKNRSEREKAWDMRGPSGGRGGSCTANNGFFGTVMRSLGMDVRITGARVSKSYGGGPEGEFDGWNHLVNLVGFEGRRWLVDVGFGGNGPTAPLELLDGNESSWGSTDDKVRLIHTSIPEFEDPSSKVWLLQHQSSSPSPSTSPGKWKDIYCFTPTEFLPQDIAVMNFKTTRDVRGSFFNHMVICLKTEMEGEDVVGWTSLVDGNVKRWIQGQRETLQVCGSEVERWEALERWFGIVLGSEEREGIRGLVTDLKGSGDED